jgi:hypothetical protein
MRPGRLRPFFTENWGKGTFAPARNYPVKAIAGHDKMRQSHTCCGETGAAVLARCNRTGKLEREA